MVKLRRAQTTVKFIDEYCQTYQNLPTEKSFFYGVYESSLEDTLMAIAQEITN